MAFLIILAIVSLFSDMTREGSDSANRASSAASTLRA